MLLLKIENCIPNNECTECTRGRREAGGREQLPLQGENCNNLSDQRLADRDITASGLVNLLQENEGVNLG